MSLLLDALKRAAEQKAAKSKQEENASADAADSSLDTSSGLASAADDAEESSLPQHRLEDETELDYSELNTRLGRVRGSGTDSTETGLDVDEYTESALAPVREKLRSGEDETLIFSVDDVAENIAEDDPEPARAADDETDLSMLVGQVPADGSGIEVDEIDSSRLAEDETDLGRLFAEQGDADRSASGGVEAERSADDETDLSRLLAEQGDAERPMATAADAERPADDETDLSRLLAEQGDAERAVPADDDAPRSAADETDLGRLASAGGEIIADGGDDAIDAGPAAGDESASEFPELSADEDSQLRPLDAGQADSGLSSAPAQQVGDSESSAGFSGDDVTDAEDDDMSLLLVEREPTQITSPRSVTSPQSPQEAMRSLQAEAPSAEELGLIETTQHRFGGDPAADADAMQGQDPTGSSATTQNRAGDTATTGIATATANLGGVPRPNPSATQTYAPDNYDRTLMRLPNDEASKLFAGMKSGSDVVMTPEHAKRIFQSKSSAIRLQHVKAYTGIAIIILLAIAVYGVFEYQNESDNIEANLRPLKNDPLPGAIRPQDAGAKEEPMFAEAEVNQRALEILQSAENLGEGQSADEPTTVPVEADAAPGPAKAAQAAVESDDARTAMPEEPVETVAEQAPAQAPVEAVKTQQPAQGTDNPQPIALSEPPRQPQISQPRAASAGTPQKTTTSATGSGARLQIETGERLEQKQVLLREAYDAYRAGDDVLALERYNRVLEIDPANRNALLARAAIHVHNGRGAAAIEDYQALLLANPKDSLAMASLLAVANVSPRESETQLKLMIRDEPDSPHLNFALANAYAAQKRWQEAQGYYFRALQNNPDDPNYAYNLAVSLEHIAQPQAAISYYRLALENYNKGLATFSRDAVGRRLDKLAKS